MHTTHAIRNFWDGTERRGPAECWPWTGSVNATGYGTMSLAPFGFPLRRAAAHRVSWEIHNGGRVPAGLCVLHSCDNPPCVNPAHLRAGTRAENMADMKARGRSRSTKLTTAQVSEIRASGESAAVLGARYGVSKSAVHRAKSGVTHRSASPA
jgi:hypothetical protein